MKVNYLNLFIALIILSATVRAEDKHFSSEEVMCYPHEEIYFSCPIGDKVMSVCASGNISPQNGYVQYRFGRPGKPELEYPEQSEPPTDRFLITDFAGGSINSTHLKFKTAGYVYVIYQSATNGVYVKNNGKTVANFSCGGGHYQQINSRAMRGIKTAVPNDDDN